MLQELLETSSLILFLSASIRAFFASSASVASRALFASAASAASATSAASAASRALFALFISFSSRANFASASSRALFPLETAAFNSALAFAIAFRRFYLSVAFLILSNFSIRSKFETFPSILYKAILVVLPTILYFY
jgi:hypothetical protein